MTHEPEKLKNLQKKRQIVDLAMLLVISLKLEGGKVV